MTYDHAMSPRLGQRTPIERPAILIAADEDSLPRSVYDGLMVWRTDLQGFQLYQDGDWVNSAGGTGPAGPPGPQGPTGAGATGGSSTGLADYLISIVSGSYQAISYAGTIVYTGASASAALAAAIAALGLTGGTIAFKSGRYTWTTTPAIEPGMTATLKIIGEQGTTIVLGATYLVGNRFLDFHRTAAGQTFQNLWLEGFTFDGAALSSTGHSHIIIGTYNQRGIADGAQINFSRITIRRMRTYNIPVSNDANLGFEYLNIFLAVNQTAAGQAQNTITDIIVEDCDFSGGNYGVAVYGSKQNSPTPWVGNADIFLDRIRISRINHDMLTSPPNFTYAAHVHIGSAGYGRTVWIDHITGFGSRDVGIEVDGMQDAHISHVAIGDCHGFALAFTNFRPPPEDIGTQLYSCDHIMSRQAGGVTDNNSSSLCGILRSQDGNGAYVNFGRVALRDVKRFRNSPRTITDSQLEGDFIRLQGPTEFYMDGGYYEAINVQHTSSTATTSPTMIYGGTVVGGLISKVTIRNCDFVWHGAYDAAATEADTTCIWLAGNTFFFIDNVTTDMFVNNVKNFSMRGIQIGGVSGSTMRGTIRGYRVVQNNDLGGRGIVVAASTLLTISSNTGIFIQDCDFRNMATYGGTEVVWTDTTNKAKFFLNRNTMKSFPPKGYLVTCPASGVSAQYIDGWPTTFYMQGANVTLLEYSRDNITFFQLSTTADNIRFKLFQGDYYRITYTVAPTLTSIPDPA